MKRSVLFFAVAILLGAGLSSCDREDINGDNNEVIDNGGGSDDNGGGGSGTDTVSLQWVDLGLPSGLLWADRNVGASSSEDYGNYYAWGETAPKEVYDWSTYAYGNAYDALTKYCNDPEFGLDGFTDNLTTLEASDDAATANLGEGARTPTKDEWQELMDNTTSTWTTQNGVNGRLLTGPNGKSLFLPAAGRRNGSSLGAGMYAFYWSSGLRYVDLPTVASGFGFDSGDQYVGGGDRCIGLSVRAVRASQH